MSRNKKQTPKKTRKKPDLLTPIVNNMETKVDNSLLSNVEIIEKTPIQASLYNIGKAFDLVAAEIIKYKSNIDALAAEANDTLNKLQTINAELKK